MVKLNLIKDILLKNKLILIFLFFPQLIGAGTSGKIAGVVKDGKSGELLPGCNIQVLSTKLGTVSNFDGEYFIINVPAGEYSLRASMIGFKSVAISRLQVNADLTTRADLHMEPTIINSEEEVTIVAERPMIQKDITSKLSVIEAKEITTMAINNIEDVLLTQAGFSKDADGNIHVRGGRSGELGYMIDGLFVKNPLYEGHPSLGGFSSLINKDAINELMVLSGTFNAEYGDAMSGVVNIITKDGTDTFHGKLEYTTPMLNSSPYRKKNPFPGVSDSYTYIKQNVIDDLSFRPLNLELPLTGGINASMSGPIPLAPKATFFVSAQSYNEDSYLPHGYNLDRDGLAKLTYQFKPGMKLSLTNQRTDREYQPYLHAWKYRPDHQTITHRRTNRLGLSWTHSVTPNLFYTLLFTRYKNNLFVHVPGKKPSEYERGQTGETVYFYVQGDDEDYINDYTLSYIGKGDLIYQLNNNHQFKGGIEFKSHLLDVYEEKEPWSSGAQFKESYHRTPVEFAAYLQDKIEYDFLIMNIGLRFDYADPKATMWQDIRRFGAFDEQNNWIPAVEKSVAPKTQLSPRIGLAHPITDRAVLHFAYGHFFQLPDYQAMYYNHHKDLSTSLPLVGNPRLKTQKTVAYETGIKYQISSDWALDVSAWYKDISDLLSTLQVSYLSQDYVVYYNSDYASVKGIDLSLRKKYSQYISASIDYTYLVAKGNNSQPLGGYVSAYEQEEIPHQEYFLDFDQRHDFAINLNLFIPRNQGPEIGKFKPLSDVNLNVLIQAESGLPYTPYVDPTLRVEINSARKPWTSTVDVRLLKKITISKITTGVFLTVTNLFDRQNVVQVYSRTGKPFDTGMANLVGTSPDADHNPTHVGPPRIIKAGIQLLW
jgi:outer membrane receptor protein involved in Fe transport